MKKTCAALALFMLAQPALAAKEIYCDVAYEAGGKTAIDTEVRMDVSAVKECGTKSFDIQIGNTPIKLGAGFAAVCGREETLSNIILWAPGTNGFAQASDYYGAFGKVKKASRSQSLQLGMAVDGVFYNVIVHCTLDK